MLQGLVGFRLYLSRIKLTKPSYHHLRKQAGHSIEKGVCRLLAGQQLGLEHLRVSSPSLLQLLQNVGKVGSCEVKSLDLSDIIDDSSRTIGLLRSILSSGGLCGIEELDYSVGFKALTETLAKGACPGLRKLFIGPHIHLKDSYVGKDACQALAAAIASGHCRMLCELTMTMMDRGAFPVIAKALQAGSCPAFTHLKMYDCIHTLSEWEALGLLLTSGGCPSLKVLILHSNSMHGHHLLPLIAALGYESSPHITDLRLVCSKMGDMGADALGHLLVSGSCPHLQLLDLSRSHDREPILRLLHSISRPGQTPTALRQLDLGFSHLDQRHGMMLEAILGQNLCPLLEALWIHGNPRIGDTGVASVLRGLLEGHCHHVKKLGLDCTGMGPLGAGVLAEALRTGLWSHLQELTFGLNHLVADGDLGGDCDVVEEPA